jgi:hypothetical protein
MGFRFSLNLMTERFGIAYRLLFVALFSVRNLSKTAHFPCQFSELKQPRAVGFRGSDVERGACRKDASGRGGAGAISTCAEHNCT